MPFVTKYTTTFGIGQFGARANTRPYPYSVFEETQQDVISNDVIDIDFYTKNDIPLFSLAANVKDTILSNAKFTNDFRGCAECEINLNSPPLVDIQYGAKVKIRVGRLYFYTGYLFKPQSEFNSKRNLFNYKFFGMRQRYAKQKINLKKYNISSITKSGDQVTYNFSDIVPSDTFINQRIGVRRCDNANNNGYFLITNISSNSVTVTSFFGVAQGSAGGDVIILPASCSNTANLSEVFKDVAKQAVIDFPELAYNPTKIEFSTGKLTAGFFDINGVDYDKIFETLEILSGNQYYMGIDQEGEFFFKKIPTGVLEVLNTGYDMVDPGLTLNYNNIANLITGERTKARGTSGNGFDVIGTAEPESDALLSQAKYGVYAKRVQLPAYLSDGSIQAVIDNVLAINKEPRNSAKIPNLKFDRFYGIGGYSICPLPDFYNTVVNECESLSGWTSGANVNLSVNTDILITGNGSLEISVSDLSNGEESRLTLASPFDLTGKQTISFWIFSSKYGNFITLELSDGVNYYDYPVNVTTVNQFFLVTIDISDIELNEITEVAFKFNSIVDATLFYLDKIDIRKFGAIHTTVPLKKATYDLQAHNSNIDLEFGDEGESLSEYLQGIQATIETQKLAAVNRN